MPTCQSCNRKWSWKQTFKKSFALSIELTCPYCKEKQYFSSRYRIRSTIIPFIMSPFIMLAGFFYGISYISLLIVISILAVFFIINPFFVELSNEEEPLF